MGLQARSHGGSQAKKLKEIRLELAYIPTPYKEESINFTVAISGQ